MSPSTKERARWARLALRSYLWAKGESLTDEDVDAAVIDLLADVRHFCDTRELAFSDLAAIAQAHHEAELAEEAWAEIEEVHGCVRAFLTREGDAS